MRSFIPFFLLSLSAFAVPSSSSGAFHSPDASSNHTLEARHSCSTGMSWKLTKCCPNDAYERGGQCICNSSSKTLSADGKSCVNKCTQSGWHQCETQCCPPGSDEVKGQCKCSGGKQLVGSGSDKRCVDACPSGQFYAKTKCCPNNSSEQSNKVCTCNSSNQKLNSAGTACIDKCPSGWKSCSSQCCPPGSDENKKGECVCTDDKKTIVGTGDNRSCQYNCPAGTNFKTSRCCPTDSFEYRGQCQCNESHKKCNSGNTKCEAICTKQGEHYTNGICCKSYLVGSGKSCVCPTTGQIDTGSTCAACPGGQNYNGVKKTCDPACPTGTQYKITRRGQGVCCRSGQTACNTVCCPAGLDEVGNSGKCCKPGSTLDPKGKCLEPTAHKKKRDAPSQLHLQDLQAAYLGMMGNADNALCPSGLAACPIEGRAEDEYECIDTQAELQSCGGCASMSQGKDCTLIAGAKWMGCVNGQCEVYSCSKGYNLVNGTSCQRH